MIFCNCTIEYLPNEAEANAIILDVSQSIEKFGLLLGANEYNRVQSFSLVDEKSKYCIVFKVDKKDSYIPETHSLHISEESLSLLKSMVCDVVTEKAFKGYHVDLEISSKGKLFDLCIVLA